MLHPSSFILPPLRLPLPAFLAVLGIVISPLSLHAGDILRGGARPNAARPGAVASEAAAVAAQQARSNAKDALSRTTQAMSAVRAMQSAARSLSLNGPNNLGPDPNHPGLMLPDVPDGLALGGLQIAGAPVGAGLPSQANVGGRAVVNIQQTAQQALLNWTTFNVGKNTTVRFDQSAGGADVGKWIAFNKVSDPSGSPSQILGSIEAPGQVYLINQNGIIFGGSSQVNTHIFVASSLPINDNLIDRGLLNNPDAQFLFSALPQPAGTKGPTPAFTPPAPLTPSGKSGDVTVQAGAQLTAPTTAANVGGRVVLIGPNVTNAGTISTPDGQTILAAGLQVGFDIHRDADPDQAASLRGLDVYVGAVDQYRLNSTYSNGGTIVTVANTAGLEVGAKVTGAGIAPGATILSITDATHYVLSVPATADGSSTPLDHSLPLYAGTATNSGFIDAPRANVTIAGKYVRQLGAIRSSTSVSLNGRIDLLASYNAIGNPITTSNVIPLFLNRSTGGVEIGPGSSMEILPEYGSAETAVGTKLALRSEVKIRGKTVHFAPDSTLLAPNAKVTVEAGVWDYALNATLAYSRFVASGGQIYLDRGSLISVAGTVDAVAPLSQHILTVDLRGAELADSPLQRTGVLRGPTITVDLRKTGTYNGIFWVGTPLANLTGYQNIIQRTVAELTVAGGSVDFKSGGSVVIQPGAVVDVSAGWINYEGGTVKTTRLMHMGRLFEIADALPDRVYDGIYTGIFTENHARWGVTKNYTVPWMTGEHYEQPYLKGADGGQLNISAPGMALDGTLLGRTIAGPRQRSAPPASSELKLSFLSELVENPAYPTVSPTPPSVVFTHDTSQQGVGAFALDEEGNPLSLPASRLDQVLLSPDLFATQGFGKLTVDNPDGNITVPANISLEAPAFGSVTLKGANVTVEGSVTAPSGAISLVAYNLSPSLVVVLNDVSKTPPPVTTPPPNLDRGMIELGSVASLNAAGLVVDDRLSAPAPLSLPLATGGGNVSLTSMSANLNAGSVIDVSGGVAIEANGKRNFGAGGSIVIKTGQDPTLTSLLGGKLKLEGILRGYSGGVGGSLSIQAALIQIGGSPLHANTLLLQPEFFQQGGFTNYSLTGIGVPMGFDGITPPSVYVAPGTVIEPRAESYIAFLNPPDSDTAKLTTILKPVGQREPTSISLNAPATKDSFQSQFLKNRGDLVIGAGAMIKTDPLASVTLNGGTVAVFGSIIAPGGSIAITGAESYPLVDLAPGILPSIVSSPPNAYATVYLAPGSRLSTAGTTIFTPNRFGNRTGTVVPGGKISISGNIVAAAGSTLDVSGATDVLDIHPSYLGLNASLTGPLAIPMVPLTSGLTTPLYPSLAVPTQIDSNGGEITLKGNQFLFVDSTLLGHAGGPSALGGKLSVSSGRFNLVGTAFSTADINLVVAQDGRTIPVPFAQSAIGQAVLDGNGNPLPAMGYFNANTFHRGGFDSLTLGGNVRFDGPVSIEARNTLRVATGGIIQADSDVNLTASYIALGQPFIPPSQGASFLFTATSAGGATSEDKVQPGYGSGRLFVTADLVDIGTLSLNNIGSASIISRGDIRGNGTFNIAGDLFLKAGQIYPTTAATFTVTAYDYVRDGNPQSGSVTIASSAPLNAPLSAGGTLSIYGSRITQGGTLLAPIGAINLGWDGVGTAPVNPLTGLAVPVTRQLELLPGSLTSVAAIDSVTGAELLIPYGMNTDGNTWVDPFGLDITASGVPQKNIILSAQNIITREGSVLDLRGGGDLFAFRFNLGNGGSRDLLGSPAGDWASGTSYTAGDIVSFNGKTYTARLDSQNQKPSVSLYWSLIPETYAVIPGYGANYAPYAPFNNTNTELNLAYPDPGYVSSRLNVGDRIYLRGGSGLSAGNYTLLPARYALLPGAYLVTPQSGFPTGSFLNPDGASFVAGYQYNDLNKSRTLSSLFSRYEIAPASTFLQRGSYESYFGNSFLSAGALAVDAKVPRLPQDGGYLLFQATQGMQLDGSVRAQGAAGGRGGLVDISSPLDILINQTGTGGGAGVLTLNSSKLSSFGAESLLIGGQRTFGATSTAVSVRAGNVTVDNAGAPLSGPEIIIAANRGLTLAPGSAIEQIGTLGGPADTLVVSGTVELKTIGESITFARGGTPISFPSGTPGTDRIVSSVGGTITFANGTTSTLAAGVPTILSAGSTVTLSSVGSISFASGTGGAIPITMGDGTLVRVSSDPTAQTSRTAVASSTQPNMVVGSGVSFSGASITLDSTYATTLDPSTQFDGRTINLNSGQISLQFANPGPLQPTVGLVLSGNALNNLQAAQSLSLLSYSSIDLYGTGSFGPQGSLALHAGGIRGFNQLGGTLALNAPSILLDNSANVPPLAAIAAPNGTLQFNAGTIQIGANQLRIDQFDTVELNASGGVLVSGAGGLTVQQALEVNAPLLTASRSATQSLTAGGAVTLQSPGTAASIVGGLGASLNIQGSSVTANSNIILPSGLVTLRGTTGNVTVGGSIDVGGTAQTFYDLVKYTDAGEITLTADAGAVSVLAGSVLNASANPGGGDAGKITINSPASLLTIQGQLLGVGGAGGNSGTLSLDVGNLTGGLLSGISPSLSGFEQSRSIRDRLDATVTVDGLTRARNFSLSSDAGSILVTGTVDGSGVTGGTIDLKAFGSLTLASGSLLNVTGQEFSHAGKGGAVVLEAGSQVNGAINAAATLNLQAASEVRLSVLENNPLLSPPLGQFTGTLHLRAPRNAANNAFAISAINGTITDASSIIAEGYKLYDLTGTAGIIRAGTTNIAGQNLITSTIQTDATNFFGAGNANYTNMLNNLLASKSGAELTYLSNALVIAPGVEIINRTGNLTLGSLTSTSTNDWNLSAFRFGPKNAPGVLTMRAAGDLTFYNALSDGFVTSAYTSALSAYNSALPVNAQSWSYRLTSGADRFSANYRDVIPLSTLAANTGSILIGKNGGANVVSGGAGAQTSTGVGNRFQVIRTGTGDITVNAGRDVRLLNQFATIYTAGVQVTNPTMGGTFDIPRPNMSTSNVGNLGNNQQSPPAPVQYTLAGGNIVITAGADITHLTKNIAGNLIADSSRQLPINWLYRRGAVDPLTGLFAESRYGFGNAAISDVASTTWWIDFTNFFEGVGALGGGDVTLIAGRDISNVDAAVPTNARMAGKDTLGNAIAPDNNNLIELGGGDLIVKAGRNIDGGAYYVERGNGDLFAGKDIKTNQTRSPSLGIVGNLANPTIMPAETWLPTTLFVGKSSFDVSARGDVLMGPVANPFLLPQGYNNTYWYKSYFSTYSHDAAVNISSLGGDVTLRKAVTIADGLTPALQAWFQSQLILTSNPASASLSQPWLRLSESSVIPFKSVFDLMPGSLTVTAFAGDVNSVGSLTLSPSPTGSLEMAAAGAINGLQPSGRKISTDPLSWASTRINISDANPASLAGTATPISYQSQVASPTLSTARNTLVTVLDSVNALFKETASSSGVLQDKQMLHTPSTLHAGDPDPVRIYAQGGDISGLTLFSPKATRVFASNDVADVAFYLQNVSDRDVSVVSAGRDIVPYNPNTASRIASTAPGNVLSLNELPLAGDIQISGPGVLQVLAGRDISLGTAGINADGTGAGITSVGNIRNPYLPFEGASLIVGAGMGSAFSLFNSSMDYEAFIADILEGPQGPQYFSELQLAGSLADLSVTTPEELRALDPEDRARVALELFFIVLRTTGRDYNKEGSPSFGSYEPGFAAISALFPDAGQGNIKTFSRNIRTTSGGDISILAPGGSLTLGNTIVGNPTTPPGIITDSGGSISIFTDGNTDIGVSRIFTLRGGDIIIWSSTGDIAAGSSSKTVASAPPTRVLIDTQSADISTDLAGLSTGGGIGVLATVKNVPPGSVDLIAPMGTVDAGDAGIRASGNLTIAANAVLNASNISVGGSTTGAPSAPSVAAPNIGGLTSASNTAGAASSAASQSMAGQRQEAPKTEEPAPSIITVEVIGYGGGSGEDEDEEERKRKKQQEQQAAPSAQ